MYIQLSDHPKFIVWNQKDESISIERVKSETNVVCCKFSYFTSKHYK